MTDGACPLWVISGHVRFNKSCPLYPRKRTLGDHAPVTNLKLYLKYLNASVSSQATLYMAASSNIVANAEGNQLEANERLIDKLKAELNKVKAELADELDKVNADINRLSALSKPALPI